jgi:nucleoside phosphorylase
MLTVIAAMDLELALLRRALQAESGVVGDDTHRMESGLALDLQVIGVGRKRAMARVKELLTSRHRPSGLEDVSGQRLLLLGFAGALDPTLRPGDLVLPTRYYRANGDFQGQGREDFLEADKEMWRQAEAAAAQAGLPVARGNSLTLDYLAATSEAKASLRRQYQADAVNMEDYWVAEAARDAGVAFLSIRSVLDAARHSLPSYLMGMNEHRGTAVLSTVGMPWRLVTLWRLAQRTQRAQRALTRFALSLIRCMEGFEGPMAATCAGES